MPALDGLRGVAVAAVVLFHAGHLRGGWLGVDLFFVLSGFLITSLLLVEAADTKHIRLGGFWARRARRLLPALGVLLVGVTVYARFLAAPEELHRIRWDSLATLFYWANWREILTQNDYWALFTAGSPLSHTWSLAIEEQFYLVWPLVVVGLLAIVARRSERGGGVDRASLGRSMTRLAIGLAFVSLAATAFWQHRAGWNRVYYGTDTRAFALLLGAAVAGWVTWRGESSAGLRRRVLDTVAIIGAVGLGVAWSTLDGTSSIAHHGGLALCSVAAVGVVLAVSRPDPGPVGRVLALAPLRWLGLISYGVYLFHWPVDVILDGDRTHLEGWPLFAVQVATTLTIATASYFLVERPVRSGRLWRRTRTAWVPVLGSIGLVGLIVFATSAGTPTPQPNWARDTAAAVARAKRDGGPRVTVIGNSVAVFLAEEGFADVVTDPPMTVLDLARVACTFPGNERAEFLDGTQWPVDQPFPCDAFGWKISSAEFRPNWIIYAENGLVFDRMKIDGRWVAGCSPEYRRVKTRLFESYLPVFEDAGAKLALVTAPPAVDPFDVHGNRADYLRLLDCGNAILRDVARDNPRSVRLVDLATRLCGDHDHCRTTTPDGSVLRPDGMHFRGAGARYVARLILADLGIETSDAPGSTGK